MTRSKHDLKTVVERLVRAATDPDGVDLVSPDLLTEAADLLQSLEGERDQWKSDAGVEFLARQAAEARVRELEAERDEAVRCLGFFASAIKSGEPWTDTCEAQYRSALQKEAQG